MEAHDHELHGATPAMNPHAFNGHAWSDPSLAARMIQAIAKQLAEADPPRAASYQSNAAGAAAELQQLATNLYAAAEPSSGARVVLSHTSLAYLARSFGWNVIATIHDGDEKAPGPRALGRMIDQARASGVDAVIVDPQDHGRLGELVARETGCDRIVELDPAASGPMEPDAYMNIMQSNLHALRSWSSPPRQPGGAS